MHEECMKSVKKWRYDKYKLVGIYEEIFWYSYYPNNMKLTAPIWLADVF